MSTGLSRREFVRLAGSTGIGLSVGGLGILGCARSAHLPSARVTTRTIDDASIANFARGLHGSVIRPADTQYEAARKVWNARFDRRPALIARCADAADVQRSIGFARSEGMLIAVRGGGHSFAGYSTCDGGLVIDLSGMKALKIDRGQEVVDAQPGLITSELDAATKPLGLATVLVGCGSVGIGGFTLGGGEGALSSKFGLSCDNLLSADVVIAGGRLVTASATG